MSYFGKSSLAFAAIIFILLAGCTPAETSDHDENIAEFEIGVNSFAEELTAPNVIIIDVREVYEYEEEHIEDSLLLPVGEISGKMIADLNIGKDDRILLYCRSGRRSAQAYKIFDALGYSNVKSLNGGLVHWKEEGMSVILGEFIGNNLKKDSISVNDSAIALQNVREFDFGEIPQFGGTVTTTFTLENAGVDDLVIGGMSTSCACTTAEIDQTIISAGEIGTITIIFDPDLHEEPIDKFSRTIFVPTNDPNNPELEYIIWVDILEKK